MGVLLVAIGNFLIGTFIPPSDEKFSKGFTGYRSKAELWSHVISVCANQTILLINPFTTKTEFNSFPYGNL